MSEVTWDLTASESQVKLRCDRVRESVAVVDVLAACGVEYTPPRRIHCIWPDHDDRSPAMQVYPDTNSVYCFACCKAGGAIEVARACAGPDGGMWPLEDALDWLEHTFGLPPLNPAETLHGRLKHLGAAPKDDRREWEQARTMIFTALGEVERGVPADILRTVAGQRSYILSAGASDPVEWATWARGMVFGSYSTSVREAGACAEEWRRLSRGELSPKFLPDEWSDDDYTNWALWDISE